MTVSRRTLVTAAAATALVRPSWRLPLSEFPAASDARFDPWLEVDGAALLENVRVISRLVGGRPILAVVKNNAYGLGLTKVAALLEPLPEIAGFAVVKTAAALALRDVVSRRRRALGRAGDLPPGARARLRAAYYVRSVSHAVPLICRTLGI